jgi:uncharacterized protein
MLVDCHCHIFTTRIVENMEARPALVSDLHLNVRGAVPLLSPNALEESAEVHGIDVCVMLPSTAPHRIRAENDRFIRWSAEYPRLRTLATLHPQMDGLAHEILRVFDSGIIGFKFSSFSQRFDLASAEVKAMLYEIERLGRERSIRPTLLFDTFVKADRHLGALPQHLTNPCKLAAVVRQYPGINVIAAHMGGLLADFDDLRRNLVPAPNLYLDTSNAAHTLTEDQFVELLCIHGSSHILFGTDWPWFDHASELAVIRALLNRAGYDQEDHHRVFGDNAQQLLGF